MRLDWPFRSLSPLPAIPEAGVKEERHEVLLGDKGAGLYGLLLGPARELQDQVRALGGGVQFGAQ